MSVGGDSLERVVLEMLDGRDRILNNLWCRIYRTICVCTINLSTVLFPVRTIKHPDVVFGEPTKVLIGI